MTEIKTVITTRRSARIDLPYDKAVAALRKIAEEEGHDLGDLKWSIKVLDWVYSALWKDPEVEKIWLYLDEDETAVKSVEKIEAPEPVQGRPIT